MIGSGDFRFWVEAEPDAHFHIRLPRAEPNLADEHVLQFNAVGTCYCQRIGATSFGRWQFHLPLTLCIGAGTGDLAEKFDADLFPRLSPTPDGQRPIALQYHVIAKYLGQSYVGEGRRSEG